MRCRIVRSVVLLLCAGCQSLALEAKPEPLPEATAARLLWEQGQTAMRQGQTDQAIACYEQSLATDPDLAQAHLSLAAAHLESGDEAAACPHLGRYVDARPEQVQVRAHYAELLFKLGRDCEARDQFTRFVADAQEHDDLAGENLIHCHSRLMEIAEHEQDAYAEHLNRGIGLFLLARARAGVKDPDSAPSCEGLLFKAAGELALARQERPEEARPCWYLFEVWSQLAQRQPATRWLREAEAAAPYTYLTSAERGSLHLASADSSSRFLRR
jgi:tetratricopeptide (TPR) repeat protein